MDAYTNSISSTGGDVDIMDYTIYFGHHHSGHLLPLISPPNHGQNLEAASNHVSGAPDNITREADSLQLRALSAPSTQSLTSSALDTSIPAWLIPFPDVAEPSDHAWTWDSFPSNYPEQQQHMEQFLRSVTVDPQLNNVDVPKFSIPSSLNTSVDPIAILHAHHGSYSVHHSYEYSNSPYISEAP
jgi:hypothetical protein